MCLDKLYETRKPNDDMVVGYKEMRRAYVGGEDVRGYHTPLYRSHTVHREGEEARSTDCTIKTEEGTTYESGFHAFATKAAALNYADGERSVVCEVLIWDIRAVGSTVWNKTYVAKNMMIMGEVK